MGYILSNFSQFNIWPVVVVGKSVFSKFLLKLFSFTLLVTLSVTAYSQKSQKYYERTEDYRKAMDLFQKEKYAAAQAYFEEIIRKENNPHTELSANSAYYRALCGLMLFNNNSENLLIEFITDYPESAKVNRAYFDLGKYQYRKRRYKKALTWFEKVDVYNLNNEDLAEYYFKVGYSYFREDNHEEAMKALYEIKDANTKYSVVAKYYFAHISYEEGNMETALKYFKEIEREPSFAPIIPYYISQILFDQEKYEELIEYASVLLDSGRAQRSHEIAKFIGESHYRLEQYDQSIPYLEKFVYNGNGVVPEDYYQIAVAYVKGENYTEAVNWYQQALSSNDSMNQIVQYNMAEAYLKIDKKRLARNALRTAYMMGDDEDLKEDALFSYAKLSYELSQSPYNDAVRAFEEYINAYPNSDKMEEAHEYLVGVYFTTRNYEEARKSLDRIENRGLKLNLAYQKILYYLGVEKMNRAKYKEAIAYFNMAIDQNYERSVKIDAMFWRAEAYFRILSYQKSAEAYNSFMKEAGAISSEYYNLAQYNLGYALYRSREYEAAIFRFRQFINNDKEADRLRNDAMLRTADSYFITKEYSNAIEYYDKASTLGVFDKDYALFQSARASGVMGDYEGKISKLSEFTRDYDQSLYYDDAIFELGDILFIRGKNEEAQTQFEKIIIEMKDSPYLGRAMLKSGLIYYTQSKDTMALDRFEVVVRDFRNTSDAKEALDKINRIYIERGDLAGYEAYMASLGVENLPKFSLDSAAYEIAENAYLENKCEDAVKNFSLYIDKYDNGVFSTNAHFYRGDCEMRSGYKEEALMDFEFVINKPKNIFTEKALAYAAAISRETGDNKKAITYYTMLEKKADKAENLDQSHYWLMKLNFTEGNVDEGIKYSEILQKKENLSDDIAQEIWLYLGRAYLKKDRYNRSYDAFKNLLNVSNEFGAEGKYNLAYIEFMRGNVDSSEVYINALLNQVPSYDYWIAKSFILWSDIYLKEGDNYQAKVSLQTVIDNYEGEDLRNVAEEKLKAIEKMESIEKERLEKEKEELEIHFDSEKDYEYLFEEEVIDEE